MRKKDRLIKEAFEVYQSVGLGDYAKKQKGGEEMEYTEGFEERIYNCIKKMHIVNPRQKARRIYLGILMLFVVCISAGFLTYHHLNRPVRVTKEFARLYQEGKKRLEDAGTEPGIAYEKGSNLKYEVVLLDTELSNKLESSDIPYQKESSAQLMKSQTKPLLREEEETGGGEWEVYNLSDRDSRYYCVLKNGNGDYALARYAGVRLEKDGQERADMEEVCREVYNITDAEDIRSITLERYQGKSKAEPDKMIAVYTKEKEKEGILSFFQQENTIYGAWEAYSHGYADNSLQPITELQKLGWQEAVEYMPENCYLLALENVYHENLLMGIVKDGEQVQIFVDMQQQRGNTKYYMLSDVVFDVGSDIDVYCVQLSEDEQKEIAKWIRNAEER